MHEIGEVEFNGGNGGIYRFMFKEAGIIEETFEVMSRDSLPLYLQEIFKKFGSAQSPYITGSLKVTVHVMELNKELDGYLQTILLHEVIDRDNKPDSMLEAEEFVIGVILESSYSLAHKRRLVQAHQGFFEAVKELYEINFKKFNEYYTSNIRELEKDQLHYQKICKVVEYLSQVSVNNIIKIGRKPGGENIPEGGFRAAA